MKDELDLAENVEATAFDYAQLPADVAISWRCRAERIGMAGRVIADNLFVIGRELAEAQKECANQKNGTFLAWTAALGYSRAAVYRFIHIYETFGDKYVTGSGHIFPNFAPTALALLAQTTTPDSAREEAIAIAETENRKVTEREIQELIAKHRAEAKAEGAAEVKAEVTAELTQASQQSFKELQEQLAEKENAIAAFNREKATLLQERAALTAKTQAAEAEKSRLLAAVDDAKNNPDKDKLLEAKKRLSEYSSEYNKIQKDEKALKTRMRGLEREEQEAAQRLRDLKRQEEIFTTTKNKFFACRDKISLTLKECQAVKQMRGLPELIDDFSRGYLLTMAKDLYEMAETVEEMASTYDVQAPVTVIPRVEVQSSHTARENKVRCIQAI